MRFIPFTVFLCSFTVALPSSAQTAPATDVARASVSIKFTGLETKVGAIMLALHDEAGWANGKVIRSERLAVTTDAPTATFVELPPGRYGVKAFHDVNGNGKLDVNIFGMPTEPYAFSRDAQGQRGPAAWADAAFEIKAGPNLQQIVIR